MLSSRATNLRGDVTRAEQWTRISGARSTIFNADPIACASRHHDQCLSRRRAGVLDEDRRGRPEEQHGNPEHLQRADRTARLLRVQGLPLRRRAVHRTIRVPLHVPERRAGRGAHPRCRQRPGHDEDLRSVGPPVPRARRPAEAERRRQRPLRGALLRIRRGRPHHLQGRAAAPVGQRPRHGPAAGAEQRRADLRLRRRSHGRDGGCRPAWPARRSSSSPTRR